MYTGDMLHIKVPNLVYMYVLWDILPSYTSMLAIINKYFLAGQTYPMFRMICHWILQLGKKPRRTPSPTSQMFRTQMMKHKPM